MRRLLTMLLGERREIRWQGRPGDIDVLQVVAHGHELIRLTPEELKLHPEESLRRLVGALYHPLFTEQVEDFAPERPECPTCGKDGKVVHYQDGWSCDKCRGGILRAESGAVTDLEDAFKTARMFGDKAEELQHRVVAILRKALDPFWNDPDALENLQARIPDVIMRAFVGDRIRRLRENPSLGTAEPVTS